MPIQPHGGTLINLKVSEEKRKLLLAQCLLMKKIQVVNRVISDIVLLAVGAYSPLKGFMGKEDYESVVSHMQLSNGKLWPIPITFPVSREVAEDIEEGSQVAILDNQLQYIAVLKVEEKFSYSKEKEAHHVFQTTDINHPGVAHLYRQGDVLLGGPIRLIQLPNMPFQEYHLEPEQSRKYFREKGWNTVTAFQTRNPIHRAHEYIQKCALEITDGLFIHPLVGETKKDDVPADVRIKSYEVLLEHYYPQEKVCLSVFPAAMRYAGPREAVFHAICRKNYGCTHIIIGRDHAGVGNYYGTYDAQALIKSLPVEELGITPLCFEHAFYCQKCEGMTSYKTCPHESAHHVFLSGTKVRERLQQGLSLPPEFTRPQVAQVLKEAYQKRRVSRK